MTLIGALVDITLYQAIVAHSRWLNSPTHGRQPQVRDSRTTLSASLQTMRKWLSSELVEGISPMNAS